MLTNMPGSDGRTGEKVFFCAARCRFCLRHLLCCSPSKPKYSHASCMACLTSVQRKGRKGFRSGRKATRKRSLTHGNWLCAQGTLEFGTWPIGVSISGLPSSLTTSCRTFRRVTKGTAVSLRVSKARVWLQGRLTRRE